MGFESSFMEEMVKLSGIQRSLLKDFAAGVDPTGTRSLEYGIQDAGAPGSGVRRALGTAGGLVGGATVVPAAISGLVEGAKGIASGGIKGGLKGFARGTYKPFTQLYRAARSTRTLGKMHAGTNISKGEAESLRALVKNRSPGLSQHVRAITGDDEALRALIGRSQQRLTSAQLASEPAIARALNKHLEGALPGTAGAAGRYAERFAPEVARRARGNVSGVAEEAVRGAGKQFREGVHGMSSTPEGLAKIRQGLLDAARKEGLFSSAQKSVGRMTTETGAALGLSAGIAGGSAYLQYGKGGNVGKRMQRLQQQQPQQAPQRPVPRAAAVPGSRIPRRPAIPPRGVKPIGAPNVPR